MTITPLLELKNVSFSYGKTRVLEDISFTVPPSTTLGIIGESGSGKSTIARLVTALETPTEGEVLLRGAAVGFSDREALKRYRNSVQMVFQDSWASLNPKLTALEIVRRPLHWRLGLSGAESTTKASEMLVEVGIPEGRHGDRPDLFSGGQRQRINIARAVGCDPEILVCDEPVSALDPTIRGQIMQLLQKLQTERNLTMLFISHDLNVISKISDEVLVLSRGKVVEAGLTADVTGSPRDPYTRTLIESAL
jgi:ABC-type glutathione transport system ATPase component